MPITISDVPRATRKPGAYLTINTAAAKLGLPVTADRLLLIGVKMAAGTATAEEPIQVFSVGEARTYFGTGSPLAHMVEAVLEQNPYLAELWVIPQAEAGAGVAATATVTIATTTVGAGVATLGIGGRSVSVAVSDDDDDESIALALKDALLANTDLPFSAVINGGDATQIDLTAKAKGPAANSWVITADITADGVSATIVQPSSGATDPDIGDALDAAFATQYDVICTHYNDASSLDDLVEHLDSVGGPMEQRPGVGVAGLTGTLSTQTTLASARNSGILSLPYLRGTLSHPMEIGAAYAAAIVAEEDRARPLNGIELTPILAPASAADLLSRTEQESCLLNGVTPLMVGPGSAVQIVRSVTTYVQNSFGSADDTLLDLQTMRTLFYVRYAVRFRAQQELGRVKLADEAKTANTTDPGKVRALILGVLLQLQDDLGYLERVEHWKDRLVVERDPLVPTRLNATIPADIVDGLHVFAGSIDLILG